MKRRLTAKNTMPGDLTLQEWGLLAIVYRRGEVGSVKELVELTGASRRTLERVLASLRQKGRITGESGNEVVSWLRQK